MPEVRPLEQLLLVVTLLAVTPRPVPALEGDSCGPVQRELSAPVQLAWSETAASCPVDWVIATTAGHGITMDIRSIFLADGDVLTIFSTNRTDKDNKMESFDSGYWNTSPVLVPNNQAVVSFRPKGSQGQDFSSVNISVSTLALDLMPSKIVYFRETTRDAGSRFRYDCSTVPEVPEVLRCDRVKQCLGGEDERNCDYHHPGCGDWVPYKAICIKIFFVFEMTSQHEHVYETSPVLSKKKCVEDHQADLASFPLDEDKEFLAELLRRSNYRTVSVNLSKMRPVAKKTDHLYRYAWQWGGAGGHVAFDQQVLQKKGMESSCAMMKVEGSRLIAEPIACVTHRPTPHGYVCFKPNIHLNGTTAKSVRIVSLQMPSASLDKYPTKKCSDGSLVHTFHSCPVAENQTNITPARGNSGHNTVPSDCGSGCLPKFQCKYGEGVHYSLTCDGHQDCVDGSDESDCQAPRLKPILKDSFVCSNLQLVPKGNRCNGVPDCVDRSDEQDCMVCNNYMVNCPNVGCVTRLHAYFLSSCKTISREYGYDTTDGDGGWIKLDGFGFSFRRNLVDPSQCPETNFRCPGSFCIPTFWLANGELDCAGGEDEDVNIERSVCAGFYRCHKTFNCVHPDFVCDGIPHCPDGDDEIFCDFVCPGNCSCEGYAFTCQGMFDLNQHLLLRYLDLSNALESHLVDINKLEYLHFANLSFCGLKNVNLADLRNLRVLDLSHNRLSSLSRLHLKSLHQILYLDISYNPLATYIDVRFASLFKMANVAKLEIMHMRNMLIKHLESGAFANCKSLITLDLSGNTIETFAMDVFDDLDALRLLKTDNPRLCCPLAAALSARCEAPTDELSSCTDLLRSVFFRLFLWVFTVLAITGNTGVLVYRLVVEKTKSFHSYRVLVMALSASDLLMGVYLAIVGVADASYQGRYVAVDLGWRHSPACKLAGALALTSCEVSAFLLCLITADRVLAICFPLKSNLRLTKKSTYLGCAAAFGMGMALALAPLLPSTRHWQFYSQTGICLPLPITRVTFPGQGYAFAVFIVLNFFLFLFVVAGQVAILRVVRHTSTAVRANRKDRESAIARRLLVVALSDFCCWFPVGLMGLLAAWGVRIPGEVNVWSAVFVLPVNSALNPFLYTINTALDRWRLAREDARQQRLVKNVQTEVDRWPEDRVETLVRYCLQRRLGGRLADDLMKRPVPSAASLTSVSGTVDTAVSPTTTPVPSPPTANRKGGGKY